jgi:BASS family bile acid:Na+ symporter
VQDLLILFVVFASIAVGILFNEAAAVFQPFPIYGTMGLFFLSFMSMELHQIWGTLRNSRWTIVFFTILKTIVFPIAIYFLFRAVAPSYAVAAMLLAGISTGVVAPFIASIVMANSPLVLVIVVLTSCLVPFSLPFLVKVLLSRSIEISLVAMIKLLATVVFVPIAAVEALRRLAPAFLRGVRKLSFPISLFFFAIINLGVFSRYADYFYRDPALIVVATIVAIAVSVICFVTGIAVFWGRSLEDQLAGAVSLGNMNNVLVIVFSYHFFGPREPTVAAMYLIPFFGLIIPLRLYHRWHTRSFPVPMRPLENGK